MTSKLFNRVDMDIMELSIISEKLSIFFQMDLVPTKITQVLTHPTNKSRLSLKNPQ